MSYDREKGCIYIQVIYISRKWLENWGQSFKTDKQNILSWLQYNHARLLLVLLVTNDFHVTSSAFSKFSQNGEGKNII
jgi:hypothetical protein